MTLQFRLSDLYLIRKEKLAVLLFHVGIMIAFLGSISPWFMWPIGSLYPILAAMMVGASMMVSNTMEHPLFNQKDVLLPIVAFIIVSTYDRLTSNSNINGLIMILFKALVFFCLIRIDTPRLFNMTTFLSKVMGVILAISLFGYFLYLFGFPLPSRHAQLGELYSYTNYYLFLLDDRTIFAIVPRFSSYFPEPSHIGSASAFLLFTQRGHWKKWYNIILLTTIFFSFSLAAYIYLTAIVFLNLWIEKKEMLRKLMITAGLFAAGVFAAFTYNGGDNLVHDLILLRLEIDDGEMAGDDRVTGNFERDYDNFLKSGDIIFGRTFDNTLEFGNAGFKVFFYDHGLMGILLVFAFYLIAVKNSRNRRSAISSILVASLYFLPSAYMLSEKLLFTIYAGAYREDQELETE